MASYWDVHPKQILTGVDVITPTPQTKSAAYVEFAGFCPVPNRELHRRAMGIGWDRSCPGA